MKAKLSFRYDHHFKFPNRNAGFIFKIKVNMNMSFRNSNCEGNFSTYVFGKSFLHYRELKIDCWISRHILCEKKNRFFICVNFRILVEKWNMYEAHIFPRPLLQTCSLETTPLCLNTQLHVYKKFQNSHS